MRARRACAASAACAASGGCYCVGRACEGDEERVALGVDLDAVVRLPRIAKRRPVQSELGCVRRRSDLVEQRRRAFDVGEEERDGACWPFWHGNRIAVQACSRKRPARAGRLASASVTALLAHAAPISYKFPLPIWLYVLAGGAAVLLSAPAAMFAVRDAQPAERRGADLYPPCGGSGSADPDDRRRRSLIADRLRRRALQHDRGVEGVLREPDDAAHLGRLLGRARHRLVARRRRLGARLAAEHRCPRARPGARAARGGSLSPTQRGSGSGRLSRCCSSGRGWS